MEGVLLAHVHIKIAFATQQSLTDLAAELGCRFGVLLLNVHLDAASLGEALVTLGTLVGLLTGVRHAMSLQVEAVGERLPAFLARVGPLARVRSEVAS